MDLYHRHPQHADTVAIVDTNLGARIRVLVLAQVFLGLLMILCQIPTAKGDC
jgi:hypothetical protein